MHTTTDRATLLQAIREDPDDDGARLAFADLLEEEGERERAEFIRYSVTYPHCGFVALTRNDPFPLLGLESIGTQPVHGWKDGQPAIEERTWMWGETDEMGCVVSDFGRNLDYKEDRGFICAIRGKSADFLRHADTLLAAHPITEVRLTTWPALERIASVPVMYRLPGRDDWRLYRYYDPDVTEHDLTRELLAAAFPRVRTWHLPGDRPE